LFKSFEKQDVVFALAGAAAVLPVISIAAFEIVMGAAIVAMIVTRTRVRWTPLWMPLALFCVWTLISWIATGDERVGFPQIKKFYVYLLLFVVASSVQTVKQVRCIGLGWAVSASASAAWGLVQFAEKYQDAIDADKDFYRAYVANRITGFMPHWMTFSGEMMMALMIVCAMIFFDTQRRWVKWLIPAGVLAALGLLAAETRSMWVGAIGGGAYLLWYWRRWTIIAIPVVAAIVILINPFGIGERAMSLVKPHGDMDSNRHRAVTRRIGWEMIKAHPWLGVGPEEVAKVYKSYVPADMTGPLPPGYYGHLHNIYIQFAAERGVPAALAIVWLLVRALCDFWRAARKAGDAERWVLRGAIAVMIAFIIGSFVEYNLGTSVTLAMFLAVIGCGYATSRLVEQSSRS
jgi:O-antigen ligase